MATKNTIKDLVYDLIDSGKDATIVIYIGHYDEDTGDDVIDASVYEGHIQALVPEDDYRSNKYRSAPTLSEVINAPDIDEAIDELYKGLPEWK